METDFLYCLEETAFQVNPVSDIKSYSPVIENLTFHMMTPYDGQSVEFKNTDGIEASAVTNAIKNGDDIPDITYFYILLKCGKDGDCFIDEEGAKKIHFNLGEGWTQSEWESQGDVFKYCVLVYNKDAVLIKECDAVRLASVNFEQVYFDSLTFCMQNIESYAPVGICSVEIQLINAVGAPLSKRVLYVQKVPVTMQIRDFAPQKHSVKLGEQIKFNWNAVGFEKGTIIPADYSINRNVSAYEETITISRQYKIQIEHMNKSVTREALVYILPPKINKFVFENDKVFWETVFVQELKYMNELNSFNNIVEAKNAKSASLYCKGHQYDIEKSIHFPDKFRQEIIALEKTILHFKNYDVAMLNWQLKNLKAFEITMGSPFAQIISTKLDGSFEYPMKKGLKFEATLTKKDGSSITIVL